MTVSEIRSNIVAWIKTGIEKNIKSSNVRTLLLAMLARIDIQEVGRLRVLKVPGNESPELEQGDKVSGVVEDTLIVNATYNGGDPNLLSSYTISQNMGDENAVLFTPQTLTDIQKQQAQANIGVDGFENPLTAYQNALTN